MISFNLEVNKTGGKTTAAQENREGCETVANLEGGGVDGLERTEGG